MDAEDLDQQIKRFEEQIDKDDPEQMKLLEAMREHTRRLHQIRGDWNKPSNFRNWNDPSPRPISTAPLAIESYKEYKTHKNKEQHVLQLLGAHEQGDTHNSSSPKLLQHTSIH